MAVSFDDTITLGAVLLAALVSLSVVTNALIGGSKWKNLYEGEKETGKACLEKIAGLEATVAEKDVQLGKLEERVKDAEEVIQTLGGAKVMEALVEQAAADQKRYIEAMKQVTMLFDKLFEKLDKHDQRAQERMLNHEGRAADRAEKTLGVLDQIGHSFSDFAEELKVRNGGENE